MPTVGLVTAGGDCPGTNAAIRGVVARLVTEGWEVVGVEKGWKGLMEGMTRPLTRDSVRGILGRGGTILGSSRLDPYVHGQGYESIRPTIESRGIDALVVIGGDGSLRTAARLEEEGIRVVGIPKTIDNDIGGTDVTFGFHTAVQVVTDAIDRLTTTAESHDRIMVVGRWAAPQAGSPPIPGSPGSGGDPRAQVRYDLDEIASRITARHDAGRTYSLVVVAGHPTSMATSPRSTRSVSSVSAAGEVVTQELESRTVTRPVSSPWGISAGVGRPPHSTGSSPPASGCRGRAHPGGQGPESWWRCGGQG